jgi:hypothetical protein
MCSSSQLGEEFTKVLDSMTAGIQTKLEGITKVAVRIDKLLKSSSLTTEAVQALLEAGANIPVLGAAFKVCKVLLNAGKGALANQAQCDTFLAHVKKVQNILAQASQHMNAAMVRAIEDVQAAVSNAMQFIEKLKEKGFIARMWKADQNKSSLQSFSMQVTESFVIMQGQLAIKTANDVTTLREEMILMFNTAHEIDKERGQCVTPEYFEKFKKEVEATCEGKGLDGITTEQLEELQTKFNFGGVKLNLGELKQEIAVINGKLSDQQLQIDQLRAELAHLHNRPVDCRLSREQQIEIQAIRLIQDQQLEVLEKQLQDGHMTPIPDLDQLSADATLKAKHGTIMKTVYDDEKGLAVAESDMAVAEETHKIEVATWKTANWAVRGEPVKGAWAMHGGRLAKVINVRRDGDVEIMYADDKALSSKLKPADLAPASPRQVLEGETLDAKKLGTLPLVSPVPGISGATADIAEVDSKPELEMDLKLALAPAMESEPEPEADPNFESFENLMLDMVHCLFF